MAQMLSFPPRLLPNGDFVTVDEYSDAGTTELLAHLVLTRQGEDRMCPLFGVPDPAFAELTLGDVAAGAALYGPDVDIVRVVNTSSGPRTVDARVEWQ